MLSILIINYLKQNELNAGVSEQNSYQNVEFEIRSFTAKKNCFLVDKRLFQVKCIKGT